MDNINYNLSQLIELHGITEISEVLNKSSSHIYKCTRGERTLSFESVEKLCRKYNIDISDFIKNKFKIRLITTEVK